jgi:hypothetical protein
MKDFDEDKALKILKASQNSVIITYKSKVTCDKGHMLSKQSGSHYENVGVICDICRTDDLDDKEVYYSCI